MKKLSIAAFASMFSRRVPKSVDSSEEEAAGKRDRRGVRFKPPLERRVPVFEPEFRSGGEV